MYENPFAGKSAEEIYEIFSGNVVTAQKVPRWPSPDIQKGFIARTGASAIRYAQDYLDLMQKDGAFSGAWRGLDYGCGFGRFASLMLQYGPATSLDVSDPMPHVQKMISEQGFENTFRLLPQVLDDSTDIGSDYSFVFAYSVFTHFNKQPFLDNIKQLYKRLRVGGKIYFTVSDIDFISHFTGHWFKENTQETEAKFKNDLMANKFLFVPTIDDDTRRDFWGRFFVTPEFLADLPLHDMKLDFLGATDSSQKLYSVTRQS